MSKYLKKTKEFRKKPIDALGVFESVHGECLVAKSDDILQLMDVDSLDIIDTHETEKKSITCVAVSDMSLDGEYPVIVTGGRNKFIQIWNPLSGAREKHVELPTNEVRCITTYTGSELYILVGTRDGKVILYDRRRDEILKILTGHAGIVYTVSLTSFVRMEDIQDRNDLSHMCVASAGADRSALTWNLKKSKHRKKFRHQWSVYSLVVANKGLSRPILCAGGAGGDIKLWDVKTAVALRSLVGHAARINGLVLWEESFQILLVSAAADKTLRVFDLISGECVCILLGHSTPVMQVVLSDVKQHPKIVSSSDDSKIIQWDLKALISDFYVTEGKDTGSRNSVPPYLPDVEAPAENVHVANLKFSSDEKDLLLDLKLKRDKRDSKPKKSAAMAAASSARAEGPDERASRSRTSSLSSDKAESSVASAAGRSRNELLITSPYIAGGSRKIASKENSVENASADSTEPRLSRHELLLSSPFIDKNNRKSRTGDVATTVESSAQAASSQITPSCPTEPRLSRNDLLASSPFIDKHNRKGRHSDAGSRAQSSDSSTQEGIGEVAPIRAMEPRLSRSGVRKNQITAKRIAPHEEGNSVGTEPSVVSVEEAAGMSTRGPPGSTVENGNSTTSVRSNRVYPDSAVAAANGCSAINDREDNARSEEEENVARFAVSVLQSAPDQAVGDSRSGSSAYMGGKDDCETQSRQPQPVVSQLVESHNRDQCDARGSPQGRIAAARSASILIMSSIINRLTLPAPGHRNKVGVSSDEEVRQEQQRNVSVNDENGCAAAEPIKTVAAHSLVVNIKRNFDGDFSSPAGSLEVDSTRSPLESRVDTDSNCGVSTTEGARELSHGAKESVSLHMDAVAREETRYQARNNFMNSCRESAEQCSDGYSAPLSQAENDLTSTLVADSVPSSLPNSTVTASNPAATMPPEQSSFASAVTATAEPSTATNVESGPPRQEIRSKDYRSLKSDFNVAQVEKELDGQQKRTEAAVRLAVRLLKRSGASVEGSTAGVTPTQSTDATGAAEVTSMADLEALKTKKLMQHKHQHARVQQSILVAKDKASGALQRRLDEMLARKKAQQVGQGTSDNGSLQNDCRGRSDSILEEDGEEDDDDDDEEDWLDIAAANLLS